MLIQNKFIWNVFLALTLSWEGLEQRIIQRHLWAKRCCGPGTAKAVVERMLLKKKSLHVNFTRTTTHYQETNNSISNRHESEVPNLPDMARLIAQITHTSYAHTQGHSSGFIPGQANGMFSSKASSRAISLALISNPKRSVLAIILSLFELFGNIG